MLLTVLRRSGRGALVTSTADKPLGESLFDCTFEELCNCSRCSGACEVLSALAIAVGDVACILAACSCDARAESSNSLPAAKACVEPATACSNRHHRVTAQGCVERLRRTPGLFALLSPFWFLADRFVDPEHLRETSTGGTPADDGGARAPAAGQFRERAAMSVSAGGAAAQSDDDLDSDSADEVNAPDPSAFLSSSADFRGTVDFPDIVRATFFNFTVPRILRHADAADVNTTDMQARLWGMFRLLEDESAQIREAVSGSLSVLFESPQPAALSSGVNSDAQRFGSAALQGASSAAAAAGLNADPKAGNASIAGLLSVMAPPPAMYLSLTAPMSAPTLSFPAGGARNVLSALERLLASSGSDGRVGVCQAVAKALGQIGCVTSSPDVLRWILVTLVTMWSDAQREFCSASTSSGLSFATLHSDINASGSPSGSSELHRAAVRLTTAQQLIFGISSSRGVDPLRLICWFEESCGGASPSDLVQSPLLAPLAMPTQPTSLRAEDAHLPLQEQLYVDIFSTLLRCVGCFLAAPPWTA